MLWAIWGLAVLLLPELLPGTLLLLAQAPVGVPVAEDGHSDPMLFQPLHLLLLPSSSSSSPQQPGAGMGRLLSHTRAAGWKAFGFGQEATLQAQVEIKATAEPTASPLPTLLLAKGKALG